MNIHFTLNSMETEAHDDASHGTTVHYIEENQWGGNANLINSVNFNTTTLKLAGKFVHLFSHLFIYIRQHVRSETRFRRYDLTSSKCFVFIQ